MTLPSSRRPRLAQELLNTEANQIKKQDLKIKLNLGEIIISTVGEWYKTNYAKRPKAQLTAKKLKRYVISLCFKVKYEYDKLPSDWLDQLKKNYGLFIHGEKSGVKKEENYMIAFMPDEHGNADGEMKEEDEFSDLSRTPSEDSLFRQEFELKNVASTSGSTSTRARRVRETRQSLKRKTPMDLKVEADRSNQQPEKQRFLDLSGEPPPAEWLSAHAKGIALPRVLRVHATEDANIIFYDYKPFPEEAPSGFTAKTIHGVGFKWWDDYMTKNKNRYEWK